MDTIKQLPSHSSTLTTRVTGDPKQGHSRHSTTQIFIVTQTSNLA